MQQTTVPVQTFLAGIKNETKRRDAEQLIEIMRAITGQPPVMWGPSIIGFGSYHYKYPSGREGDAGAAGFSPRTANLVIYFPEGTSMHKELLATIGPHRISKVCLYIKRLDDVNLAVLKKLIETSYAYVMAHRHDMPRALPLSDA